MEIDQGQGELNSITGTTTSAVVYNDDEAPAEPPAAAHASRSGVLILNTHCEYPAVPNEANHDGFAVMVHVKAPPLMAAETLDLVAVLDVSDSMAGTKLAQVKRAMGFVVDRLGPRDRLSVVACSNGARRVVRLTCMTEDGKAAVKRAVGALEASGGGSANLRSGLDEAAKVLDGSRQYRNDIASVILVSGGMQGNTGDCNDDVLVLVPPFLRPAWGSGYRRTPVHTFLLGSESNHDASSSSMYNISEVTGGIFSFVEDHTVIQDALARCIAGLRSTVVQHAWINVESWCLDPEVVNAVKSGRYKSCVNGGADSREAAWIDVDDLYADEERRFLLFMDVPAAEDAGHDSTRLIRATCTYTDMASRQNVDVAPADGFAEVLRPLQQTMMTETDVARGVEVERELLRVAAAGDMALAREAAERGAYDEAARILDTRRESLSRSAPALAGDAMCTAVAAELHELSQRVSDEREYKKTGRACILASMSSHSLQRGSSSSLIRFGCGVGSSSVFATPAMRKMEKLSETMRKQQEAPPRPPLPANGSMTGVHPLGSRRRLEARLASAVPRLSMLGKYRRLLLKR